MAAVNEPQGFAEVLREAVDARGLTLARIVDRLKQRGASTTIATLSYWQTGARRPGRRSSLEVLNALEEVLDLPDGALIAALESQDPQPEPPQDPMVGWEAGDTIESLLRSSGMSLEDDFERLSLHDRVSVTPPGESDLIRVRRVFRATRDGAQTWVVAHQQDRVGTHDLPEVRAVHGCYVRRIFGVAASGLILVELATERPLARGESVLVEYEHHDVAQMRLRRFYERRFVAPHREYYLEVAFETDSMPVRAETYTLRSEVRTEIIAPLQLAGNTLQFGMADPELGNVGVRWDW